MNILTNSITQRIALVAIIIILLLYGLNKIQNYEAKLLLQKHNLEALKDTSKMYQDKYGNSIADRLALIGDIDKLKEYNNSLLKSIEELENEDKIVLGGSHNDITISGFNGDSTNTIHEFYGTYGNLIFEFNEKKDGYSRILEGYTKYKLDTLNNKIEIYPLNTYITVDELKILIETFFVKNSDGSYSALAKSPYADLNIITSGVLFPDVIIKEIPTTKYKDGKNISVGIQIGLGLNPIEFYNTGKVPIVPYIGIGLQYELYSIYNF